MELRAGQHATEGGQLRCALTSARRDSACTLYTEGADADTIAEAAAVASADTKRHLWFNHGGWATICAPETSHGCDDAPQLCTLTMYASLRGSSL